MATQQTLSPSLAKSLSARLLVLTVLFVMLAEVFIFAPSIARYRKVYLEDHLDKAQLAAMSLEASPNLEVSDELEARVLKHAGAHAVILRNPGHTVLAMSEKMPEGVDLTIHLHDITFWGWMRDAFETLLQTHNRVLRVLGPSRRESGVMVEVLLDETPLREAMYGYSQRILGLSIVISLITATFVFLSLQWLMVRPMRRLTRSMVRFRQAPEDASRVIPPTRRSDEIGIAQRELAEMQTELRAALTQKNRLAALGAAVAKINHDLRNTLSTAMLISDRLTMSDDPDVRQVTPRLFETIDKAVVMCSQTLEYASDKPPRVKKRLQPLFAIVDEAQAMAEPVMPAEDGALRWDNTVPADMQAWADRDQLVRVLTNLGRNARQAGASTLTVSAEAGDGQLYVYVADDGPGLPDKAREHLFEPFQASARKGGTGLGLSIAADLMRAHGGHICLHKSDGGGTTFRLELPEPPPPEEAEKEET